MRISIFLLATLFYTSVFSQAKLSKKQLDELPNTVENQFIKTYGKASNWQKYKMITRTDFKVLQNNIVDSVSQLKKNITTHQLKIKEQNKNINSLNEQINSLTTNLNVAVDKEDKMSLLGIGVNKSSYNITLWSIISLLLLGIFFFVYKFKNSNVLTKTAKQDLASIEEEFDQYRKKAIEKEQKLRRQLQDEINKQRGV